MEQTPNKKIELPVITRKRNEEKEYINKQYFDETYLRSVNVKDFVTGDRITPNRCAIFRDKSDDITTIALSKEDFLKKMSEKGIMELIKIT